MPIAKVQSARRGSKTGWPTWTGQVSPDLNGQLLAIQGNRHRGDVVEEALREYAEKRAPKSDRRSGSPERRKKAA